MIRHLALLALLSASPAIAQEWTATISVSGPVQDNYAIAGTRNTIMSDGRGIYMSAEAFAEGVDLGQTTCATAQTFEIDYYFGNERRFGGHVLFTLARTGSGYQPIDPAIFFDHIASNGDVIETYADFDTAQLAVLNAECLPNGLLDLEVNFKGALLSGMGAGPETIRLSGTANAQLILKDMNEY